MQGAAAVRELPLVNGGVALVDADEFERLSRRRWRLDRKGYVQLTGQDYRAYGKRVVTYLHHQILPRHPERHTVVDHIDGNPLNNTRANLRYATNGQNQANRRRILAGAGIKGVTWHRRCAKYQVQVVCEGRTHYVGLFDDPIAAGEAYEAKARALFGDYAWSNVSEVARLRRETEDGARALLALVRAVARAKAA